jgi:hypothetical protein
MERWLRNEYAAKAVRKKTPLFETASRLDRCLLLCCLPVLTIPDDVAVQSFGRNEFAVAGLAKFIFLYDPCFFILPH